VIVLKKENSILFICVFLITTFPFVRIVPVKADPEIIRVPTDFPTIQAAIDNANPGAIIYVAKGNYTEHLAISKTLSLIGEDRDTTIIDGFDADTVISISADNVLIEGITVLKSVLRTSDTGIRVIGAKGIFISRTKVLNTSAGIIFSSSINSIISNSAILSNYYGLYLLYCNNNSFLNNVFSGNVYAISLYFSILNTFAGNTLSGDSQGVFLPQTSNRNYFYHNNFMDKAPVISDAVNSWYRGNEGNYWVNFNLTNRDLNGDGISDEPYSIDERNFDYYPLMGAFSEYDISVGGLTHYVTIISNSTISDLRFGIGEETGNRIIAFNVLGESGTMGFCRIMIPIALMDRPYSVADSTGPIPLSLLSASNETHSHIYFSYLHENMTISIFYSRELALYNELLDKYDKLQADLESLNSAYNDLRANYTVDYQALLNNFNALLQNISRLQNDILSMNSSLQQSLTNQTDNVQNLRNLAYVFAALTAAFLITTVYVSSRLYAIKKPKNHNFDEED
jgi:parallel beta-helix repeat protein